MSLTSYQAAPPRDPVDDEYTGRVRFRKLFVRKD